LKGWPFKEMAILPPDVMTRKPFAPPPFKLSAFATLTMLVQTPFAWGPERERPVRR
jgi:hypothetical protein